MSTASLEQNHEAVAPVDAATVDAASVVQERLAAPIAASAVEGQRPSWLSQGSLETLRPSLQTFAALKPQLIDQLLPALRILGLAVVAGVGLRITGAVLGSIDELPLLGRLLQLVGLVAAIQFLSRNALQQQQRAALLARIQQLKLDVLG
jgi:hypothetical protein